YPCRPSGGQLAARRLHAAVARGVRPHGDSDHQRSIRPAAGSRADVRTHRKPGTISMGSFGTGSASHLAGELFKMMAGVNLLHVPYRGGAPMVTDLVGGQHQHELNRLLRLNIPNTVLC